MIEDLIVIPTNNGFKLLDDLLHSINDDIPILVVDTGSDDEAHLEYLRELANNQLFKEDARIMVDYTPMRGYACGAKLWAYWNYPAKNYLFLQDSLIAIESDILAPFKAKMPLRVDKKNLAAIDRGAVGWASFNFEFDPGLQEAAMRYMYGDHIPQYGIFGPIFYTNRDSLEELEKAGLLPTYPTHANGAQGLERAWAMVFKGAGMEVNFIHNLPNVTLTASGLYSPFRKVFVKRK